MKTRKLLALMVSASMTFNLLGYAAGDIVSADETEEVITEEAPENTEETDSIPEGSDIAEDDIKPEEEVELTEETTEEAVEEIPEEIAEAIVSAPFNQEAEVDGVIVSVIADEGVFPEGAYMSVTRVYDPDTDALVQENIGEGSDIAYAFTFDITVYDSEGNEIEPETEAGNVYVSFRNEYVSDPNLDMDIYHITEEEIVELDISIDNDMAIASTDGFSYYSVVFTRGTYEYHINNYTILTANALATHVGLNGEVTSASSEDSDKVNVYTDSNDTWFIDVNGPFDGTVNVTITIGSVDYTIGVTTDTTVAQSGNDSQMRFAVASNGRGFDVFGYEGSETVYSTFSDRPGYRTHMSVNNNTDILFYDSFEFGKVFTSHGVEAYLTAEVIDGAVYVTYTMTNTSAETTANVRIGTAADCMIGTQTKHNDYAVVEEYNGGLIMREDLKLRSDLTTPNPDLGHHFFYLNSGIGGFSTLYSNRRNLTASMEDHVFDTGVTNVLNGYPGNSQGIDSAICYSWNLNLAPGETARRVAIFSITDSVTYNTVTYNPNNGNSSSSAYSASMMANTPAQLNANRFPAPSGLAFKGWATSANGPVLYADEATITPTESMNLFAIWKPAASISSTPVPSSSPIYTGDPVELVDPNNAGSSTDGTVVYSTDGGSTWSSDIPTATDPGNYTVQYKVAGDDDHADSDTGSFNVTVLSAPEAVSGLVYTGYDQDLVSAPSAMPTGYEEVWYSLDGEHWISTVPAGNDADDYTVHYKFVDTDNVETDIEGTVAVTISAATASIGTSQSPQPVESTFTGNEIAVVTPPVSTPAGYTVEYSTDGSSWSAELPKGTHVGTYTVHYRFNGDSNHEDIADASFVITSNITAMTPADSQKPTANSGAYEPGGRPLVNAPSASDIPSGYHLEYRTSDTGSWSTDIPSGSVGDYSVQYRYVDDNGNEDYIGGTIEVSVTAASAGDISDSQKPTAVNASYDPNGVALANAPQTALTGYTVEYSLDGNSWSTTIPTGDQVGDYTVYYRFTGDANHQDAAGGSFISHITAATPSDSQKPTANNTTYADHDVSLVNVPASPITGVTVEYSLNGNSWSTTPPTGGAGTYNVQYRYNDGNDNFNYAGGTIEVTIAQASAGTIGESSKPTAVNASYDPDGVALANAPQTALTGYTVEYSLDGNNWSTTIPTGDQVGDYTVYYRFTGDANHQDAAGGSFTSHITAATPSDSQKPTANNTTYADHDVSLVNVPASPITGVTVEYSLNGNSWSTTPPTGGAGTYNVQYRYNDGNDNFNYAGGTIEVTIAQASAGTIGESSKPTAVNASYDPDGVALANAPQTALTGYTVEYSLDGNSWSSTIPTGDQVGDYTVYYRYTGDANHQDAAGGSFVSHITPAAAPSLDSLSSANKPSAVIGLYYNENDQELVNDPSSMPSGYDQIWYSTDGGNNWSQDIPTGKDSGTYNVTYKYADSNGNHAELMGDTIPVTIYAGAAPDPSTLTDDQKPHAVENLTYDGAPHVLVTPPSSYPDDYEQVWYSTDGGVTWQDTLPTETDAGDYSVTYKYVDAQGSYAELLGGTIPVTIAPAEAPSADSLSDANRPSAVDGLGYTGSEQALVNAPSALPSGYEQVWYSTDGGNTWSQDIPTGTDAGEYTVSVKYVDTDGNYEDLTGVAVPVTIAPAQAPSEDSLSDANRPSAVDGLRYIGSAQALVNAPSVLPSGYDQVWYSTDGGNTWSQSIPTGTDVGDYEVSIKYTDSNGNHEDITGVTVPVTIDPAEAPDASSLTADQKPTAVYGLSENGSAQALVNAPVSLPSGYDEVWYSTDGGNTWSQTIPTGTDAGTYNVGVKYVDTDGNYADLTGVTVPVTIASAAAAELTDDQKASAVGGLTYTGSSQALVTAPSSLPSGYEQVLYSIDGGNTWSQTIPAGTDAGTYTVNTRYVDTDGVLPDIYGPAITVVIAAATATVTIAGEEQTVTVGQTIARPDDPSRYGYDFTGWYVDEACTIPYDFNTPVGVLGVTLYPGWSQISYSLVSGAGSSFNASTTPNLVFRAVRNNNEPSTFSHFTGIKVDGNTVGTENYTAVSGSVIVTLNADYLKTLSAGEHTLEILFNDGPSVTTTFTIVASVASTGETPCSVFMIMGMLFITTAAAFVVRSREA